MARNHSSGEVVVPLWTVLAAIASVGAAAFGWLFLRVADLQDQLIEMYKIIHEMHNTTGLGL